MTDSFIQTISEETVGLVVYLKDADEYEKSHKALLDFQQKINKPVLICLNEKIELLNPDDLKRFGLQRIGPQK